MLDVRAKTHQAQVRVAGVVTALKLKNTKKGDRYATLTLEDYSGTVETIVWPDTYKNVSHILAGEDPVIVGGRIDVTEERCTLITDKIESLTALRDRHATQGLLVLKENDDYEDRLDALLGVFKKHMGSCPVKVKIEVEGVEVSLMLKDKREAPVSVLPSEALCDEVEQLFGRPVLSFM